MNPNKRPRVNIPPSPRCVIARRGPITARRIANLAPSLAKIAVAVEVSNPTAMIAIIVRTII